MTTPRKRWTRGHSGWAFGTVLIFTLGIVFGLIWGQLLVGLFLAFAVSIGWLIAYESWRGKHVGLEDPDDSGAQL
jgi:hypothetical protein